MTIDQRINTFRNRKRAFGAGIVLSLAVMAGSAVINWPPVAPREQKQLEQAIDFRDNYTSMRWDEAKGEMVIMHKEEQEAKANIKIEELKNSEPVKTYESTLARCAKNAPIWGIISVMGSLISTYGFGYNRHRQKEEENKEKLRRRFSRFPNFI